MIDVKHVRNERTRRVYVVLKNPSHESTYVIQGITRQGTPTKHTPSALWDRVFDTATEAEQAILNY